MSHSAMRQPGRVAAVQDGVAYLLASVVGATVLTVSAFYLWRLALQVHMPRRLAWSLPVTLDVGATMATIFWVGGTGRVRRWACGIALTALVGTLVGNALSHLLEAGIVRVNPVLVIAIGAVYPAMAAALAHLTLMLTTQRSAELVEDASAEASPAADDASPLLEDASPIDQAPEPAAVEVVVMHQRPAIDASAEVSEPVSRRTSTPERRRRWIAARLDAGQAVTGGDVERRFGSRNGARELAQVVAARSEAVAGAGGAR